MKLHSIEDLFKHEIKDLYDAEHRISKALNEVKTTITDEELKTAVIEHQKQTEEHIERLEKIFNILEMKPEGKECKGVKGIIEEAQEVLKADTTPESLDAALIGAMQRVEHYEMASYGCAITYADLLGYSEASDLLEETLSEEEETDEKLTEIAESRVNEKAMNNSNEE